MFTANSQEAISCRAGGTPEPQVRWEMPDGQVAGTEGRVHQEGSTLLFNPTQKGDSGTYICTANNKAGKKSQEHRVTVACEQILSLSLSLSLFISFIFPSVG